MTKSILCVLFTLICYTHGFITESGLVFEDAQCAEDLQLYWNDLKSLQKWTLPFLDASTKIPKSVLTGNLIDMGNYDECLGIKYQITPSRTIKGKFCMVKIELPPNILGFSQQDATERIVADFSGKPGLTLATCVPNSCNPKDIETGYKFVWDTVVGSFIPSAKSLNISVLDFTCATADDVVQWEYGDIITVILLGIIAYSAVMSTVYDIYVRQKGEKPRHKILVAFSVYSNGLKILSTAPGADQLSCLHGLRVISIMWIILGHKHAISLVSPLLNFTDIPSWLRKLSNMFVIGAPVSVDTFLVLSGLLVVYVSLKAMDKEIKFNIPLFYLHRYIRLTPVLAIVILVHVTIFKFFGNGPYWNFGYEAWKKGCVDNWWSSLLYLQNYVNPDDVCLTQTWYLSVDTQLFLLSPLIILPMWHWKHKSMIWNMFLLIGSIIIDFVISYVYKIPALEFSQINDLDRINEYNNKYYVPTHTRYGPWLMGAILGYYIFQIKSRRIKPVHMNPTVVASGWTISLLTMISVVWAPYNFMEHDYNLIEASVFNAIHKHAWSLALCWIIFACTEGYGGVVNWFLSLPLFQILGRLTYSMYIIHFSIMLAKIARVKNTEYFTEFDTLLDFWGDFMMTIFMSVILTLLFESPMIIIEKIIFGSEKLNAKKTNLETASRTEQADKMD